MNAWGLALIVATSALASESQDFSRYQIIVDRSPFGPVTAAGTPETVPNFAQRFQLVGIVTSNGAAATVQAVLLDKDANPARSWFKAEGEMIEGGVKVLRIQDALTSKAKVVLQFGLETAALSFPERPVGPVAAPVPGQPQPAPGTVPARPPFPSRIPFRRSN